MYGERSFELEEAFYTYRGMDSLCGTYCQYFTDCLWQRAKEDKRDSIFIRRLRLRV